MNLTRWESQQVRKRLNAWIKLKAVEYVMGEMKNLKPNFDARVVYIRRGISKVREGLSHMSDDIDGLERNLDQLNDEYQSFHNAVMNLLEKQNG